MKRVARGSASDGTQSIRRCVAILRQVANGKPEGTRLVEISERTGLSRSTAHRILTCLDDEGLVRRNPRTRRYELDDTAFILGLPGLSPVMQSCRASLERIAAKTGECCTLVLRSGFDSISVDRVMGKSPIHGLQLIGGERRPLGTASGSVAILARLEDDQVEYINKRNALQLGRYGVDAKGVKAAVRDCRIMGYAKMRSPITADVSSLGMGVPRPRGGAIAALAIIGSAHSITGSRERSLAKILHEEAALLAKLPGFQGGDSFVTAPLN